MWPYNPDAMADKVSRSTSSLSSNSTNINKSPRNILLPQASPSSGTSPNTSSSITSSTSTPAVSTGMVSINFTINSNSTFDQNPVNTAEQMLAEISNIEPIQPTVVDDNNLPSSIDLVHSPPQPVESTTTISHSQSIHTIEPVQNINQKSLSTFSSGNKNVYSCKDDFIFLLLGFNEEQEVEKPSIPAIDAVREIVVNIFSEHRQQVLECQHASKLPRASRLKNKTGINITDMNIFDIIKENEKTKIKKNMKSSMKTKNKTKKNSKKKKKTVIGIDDNQENSDDMDYELNIREQLDEAIEETASITNGII